MTAPCEIAGLPILTCKVVMSEIGVWHADLEASGETAPSGPVTLTLHGSKFVGTVIRATAISGRVKARIAGGAGNLSATVTAKHWTKPLVSEVVRSTLEACGETLSTTSDAVLLLKRLDQWKRSEEAGSRALQAICDKIGAIWRVLADGTVWIGLATYPEVALTYILIDEDWSAGVIEVAPEAPTLIPGVTFRGQTIRHVVHRVTSASLRSEACLEPPSGLLDRFLAGIRSEIGYSRAYPARVVRQNSDKSLQVVPDDQKLKSSGLDKVKIRPGVPGFIPVVKAGARGAVEFENGDPSKPCVGAWEYDASKVTSVSYLGGTRAFARVGDQVQVFLGIGSTFYFAGTVGGSPATGTMTVTYVTPAYGIISTGNPQLTG